MAIYRTLRSFLVITVILTMVVLAGCNSGSSSDEQLSNTDLIEPRGAHTATLLPNGKVMVIGGRGYSGSSLPSGLSSTETYDPSFIPDPDDPTKGAWSSSSSMEEGRFDHSAIVLDNGNILVTGGDEKPGAVRGYYSLPPFARMSTEIYNPSNGEWNTVGSMINEHGAGHTATLLPSGSVLVTGGMQDAEEKDVPRITSPHSELYDPATKTWSATGNMSQARAKHKAVLMTNGQVLVVGSDSYELYDPPSETWTKTGNMPVDHGGQFTATLLEDGRVIVVGGGISRMVEGVEVSPPTPIDAVSLYDPSSDKWSQGANMLNSSLGHTATLMTEGSLLIVGHILAQIYDPASDTWSSADQMSTERGAAMIGGPAGSFHTATLMKDNSVLIIGGNSLELNKYGAVLERTGVASVESYNTNTGWD